MGKNVAEVEEAAHYSCDMKVHSLMCGELKTFVDRIACIFPAIESARPGCKSGIQALCSLNVAIDKAKLLLQHCAEASKLYLAITGESILLRCERSQKALGLCLIEIHNMVPQPLSSQISEIVNDLRDAKFSLESSAQEAGRTLLALLRQDRSATDSTEVLEFQAFRIAALQLNLISPKALLIEQRSIKKLLNKISDADQRKESILKYLLYLLKKYGKFVGHKSTDEVDGSHKCSSSTTDPASHSSVCQISVESSGPRLSMSSSCLNAQTDMYSTLIPPKEFRCPISSKLMFDPVVIASGQTYERIWIEKWFSEGHDTCPGTLKKLSHQFMTPNSCLKDLISNWCKMHGVTVQDPCSGPVPALFCSWSISSSSFSSCGSSLNGVPALISDRETADYTNQSDISSITISSSDTSYCMDLSQNKIIGSLKDSHFQIFSVGIDSHRSQTSMDFRDEIYPNFLYKLSMLPLDSRLKAVEDVGNFMKDNDEACHMLLSNGFLEAVMKFLKTAHEDSNTNAQKTGAQMLLAFLSSSRIEISSLDEDAFHLLASFLKSEISEEATSILQMLSSHWLCKSAIVASGALPFIMEILESQVGEPLVHAVEILLDLSSHSEMRSHIVSSGCISKLIPLLGDDKLAGNCINILRNLSDIEAARLAIVGSNECIASLVELLDTASLDEQEHVVVILLSVCSQGFECCQAVMKEGVIPSLFSISVNGNSRAKITARKLLQILRDFSHTDSPESPHLQIESVPVSQDSGHICKEKRSASKASGFFKKKMSFFMKSRTSSIGQVAL